MQPERLAAAWRFTPANARECAASAANGNASRKAPLYAVSGVAPSHSSGVVSRLMPSKCSDSDSEPWSGQKIGASHHLCVIGNARASHERIIAVRAESYGSWGHAEDRCVTTGHKTTT